MPRPSVVSAAEYRRLAMTEKQLHEAIVELAGWFGWDHFHAYDMRRSDVGWPDLALARRPRLIFAELKRDGKDPTPAQRRWLETLAACGVETAVWRPADWISGEIERRLR